MKKICFLLPFLAFITTQVQAEDSTICAQIIQPAVNNLGICQEFATPCDVPSDWKKLPVSSCSDVKSDKTSARIDSVQKRRQIRWATALRKKAKERAPEIAERKYRKRSDRPRIGSAQFTKENDTINNLSNRRRSSLASNARKTFTTKSYDSDFISKRKQYSTNKGGFQHTNKADKTERARRRLARPGIQSRSDAIREGALQNDPKLSERRSQRFRSLGGASHWRNKGRVKKIKKEKADPRQKIGLRSIYRGTTSERRNAGLSRTTTK